MNRSKPFLKALLGAGLIALVITVLPAVAQQQPTGATATGDQTADTDNTDQKGKESPPSGTSNDRLFYTLPNFLTVHNLELLPPLTPGQKFKVVARSSFDYVEYFWYAALAGISQAENSEPGYGQGAAGYGKRYGAAFADGTIENFMTAAVLPSLLRQDPRFYQSGKGSFWRRTSYAVSRIFVTFTDSGHQQFNYSEIVGSALAAGISTYSYHPQNERNLANTASVWGTQVGYDTLTIVVKEFWPDIRQRVDKMRGREAATP
ncbi:MAG TPA: hypothetical protein VEJ45_09730 [Candidatus Acidoferrales bacterium]|nr:hypothetical protein [Candidatus Acidoferrales bacterium]